MIRFSAALVAVAIGVLVGGIASSKLLLVYIAIVVSAVAMLALAIGVVLKREELFGGQGLVPAGAGASPAPSAPGGDSRRAGWPAGGDNRQPGQPGQGGSPLTTGTPGLGTAFGGIAAVASAPAGATQAGAPGSSARPWGSLEARDPWSLSPRPAQPASPPPASQPQTTDADAGSDAAPRSWFDRLGEPADASTPTASPGPPSAWAAWPSPAADPAEATAPSASVQAAGPDEAAPGDDVTGDVGPPGDVVTPAAEDLTPTAVPDGEDDRPGAAEPADAGDQPDAAEPADEGDRPGAAEATDEDDAWPAPAAPTVSVAVLRSSGQPSAPVPPVPSGTSPGAVGAEAVEVPADSQDDAGSPGPARPGKVPATVAASVIVAAPATVAAPVIGAAKDEDEAEADDAEGTDGDDEPAPADASDPPAETADGAAQSTLVSVIRGVPRFHEPDCVLIRFMPEGDVQKLPVSEAEAAGCTPCAACQPAR